MMSLRSQKSGQRGVVLIVALVALVILSLAAVALVRSVDTATIIAGNLAFKQSATNSGEGALIRANQWIASQIESDGVSANDILEGTNAVDVATGVAAGYYATTTGLATKNGYDPDSVSHFEMLSKEGTWKTDRSQAAQVADCSGSLGDTDCSGNKIRYVIERMCTNTGPADCSSCLCGPIADGTSSFSVKTATGAGAPATSGGTPMYRVTARASGPKNSVSYIQTFIY